MDDAGDAKRFANTIFANVTFTKKGSVHTQQPIVVQGVNNWYILPRADIKQRGRERGEPVVNVHHIGPKRGKSGSESGLRSGRHPELA